MTKMVLITLDFFLLALQTHYELIATFPSQINQKLQMSEIRLHFPSKLLEYSCPERLALARLLARFNSLQYCNPE